MISNLKIEINGLPHSYASFNEWNAQLIMSNRANSRVIQRKKIGGYYRSRFNANFKPSAIISARVNAEYAVYNSQYDMPFDTPSKEDKEIKKADVIDMHQYLKKDVYRVLKDKVLGYKEIISDEDFEAPSEKTIGDTLFFIDNILKKHGVIASKVRPVADGEINFFWNNREFTLDVALYGDDKYYYYFEDKVKKVKYSKENGLEQPLDEDALKMIKSKW